MYYFFDNVIDICEIVLYFVMIEYINWFVGEDGVDEQKGCYIWVVLWFIDGKEMQFCCWQVVEVVIGVCYQFIGFFGGGVQVDWVVDVVVF